MTRKAALATPRTDRQKLLTERVETPPLSDLPLFVGHDRDRTQMIDLQVVDPLLGKSRTGLSTPSRYPLHARNDPARRVHRILIADSQTAVDIETFAAL